MTDLVPQVVVQPCYWLGDALYPDMLRVDVRLPRGRPHEMHELYPLAAVQVGELIKQVLGYWDV